MTAKAYLMEINIERRRLDDMAERIERNRTQAERLSQQLTGMPHGGSGATPDEMWLRIVDESRELDAARAQLRLREEEAEKIIAMLNDAKYERVLRRRYLLGHAWPKIAREMHYTIDGIFTLHGRALQRLDCVYDFSKEKSRI